MKILSLEYEDKAFGWKLEETKFEDLTLLVGASGVGKTQILRAIQILANITRGMSVNGVKWKVEFCTNECDTYIWEGEFEYAETLSEWRRKPSLGNFQVQIMHEKLIKNGIEILDRTPKNEITLDGSKLTIRLSPRESVLKLLSEVDLIGPITKGFKRIVSSDFSSKRRDASADDYNSLFPLHTTDMYFSDKEVQSMNGLNDKLFKASLDSDPVFMQIKQSFLDVFPFVEDMEIREEQLIPVEPASMYRTLYFKEHGVEKWIHESVMSSGMLRTLTQIAEIYLCPSGTIFLIDEFENGLGINCIDDVVNSMLLHERDLQFILTSHHPYIINNIGLEHWKIVTRTGGTVSTHDASEFNLGKSKHEAFTQLINLDEYLEGVTA